MKNFGKLLSASALGAALLAASPAQAVTVLTFEGVGDFNPVGGFYGPEYVFSPATLALVDSDAGGSGNFANEPSGDTIMFFLDANNAILNVAGGFDTGFAFYYSSSTAATVNVYDGLNATGNLLGSINLVAQHTNNCVGDPNGTFCNWTNIGVAFNGIARSIDFGGTANFTGYDNITFGSDIAGGVPEPTAWLLMILGFGVTGSALRHARRKAVRVAYS